nr:MAG TPA: hypothetical protein [Caudoviricetes sp.]
MTDYEKAIILNGIAVLAIYVGLAIALIAGMIFLPWWPAKAACALIATYGLLRTLAAYYVSR